MQKFLNYKMLKDVKFGQTRKQFSFEFENYQKIFLEILWKSGIKRIQIAQGVLYSLH